MYSAIQHVRRQLCLTGYIKNKLTNIFLKENFWEMFFLQLTYFLKILLKYIYIFSILLLQQMHNQSKHTFTHMVLGDVSTLSENVNCKLQTL